MKNANSLISLFLSALVLIPEVALAITLDPIIVTTNKRPVRASKVSAFVRVIDREEIESLGGGSLKEVLQSSGAVDLVSLGTQGDDFDIRLRGSDRDGVLVLVDGVPYNTVTERRANLLGTFPIAAIESIEIVKGAASSLYGSDAVGGVIHIKTVKDGCGSPARAQVEGGNLSTFKASMTYNFCQENYNNRLFLSAKNVGGQFANDELNSLHAANAFRVDITPKLKANVDFHFSRSEQDIYYDSSLVLSQLADDGFAPQDIDGDGAADFIFINTVEPDDNRYVIRHNILGGIGLAYDWGAAGQSSFRYSINLDKVREFNGDDGAGVESDFHLTGFRHLLQANHQFQFGMGDFAYNDVLVGFDTEIETLEFNDKADDSSFPDSGQEGVRRNYAPYIQHSFYAFDDSLVVNWGLRFDYNTTFGSALSPHASILYELPKIETRLKAGYRKGFHGPSIVSFYTAELTRDLGFPIIDDQLEAEKSHTFEGGIEQPLGDWGLVQTAAFYTDYNFMFDELEYVEDAYLWGIESGLLLQPLSFVELGAFYTFLKTKNKDRNEALPNRPQHSVKAHVQLNPWKPLKLRMDFTYKSERLAPIGLSTGSGDFFFVFREFDDDAGDYRYIGGSEDPVFDEDERVLASYYKFDISLHFDVPKTVLNESLESLRFYARIDNLLDEEYEEKFLFALPGRTFTLGAQAQF